MSTNQIIAIGYTGTYRVYLNVPLEEAKKRFKQRYEAEYDPEFVEVFPLNWEDYEIDMIDFDDEFEAYAVWGI